MSDHELIPTLVSAAPHLGFRLQERQILSSLEPGACHGRRRSGCAGRTLRAILPGGLSRAVLSFFPSSFFFFFFFFFCCREGAANPESRPLNRRILRSRRDLR